jgi:epoxyqueuosine reductase
MPRPCDQFLLMVSAQQAMKFAYKFGMNRLTTQLTERAHQLGFDRVGVTPADPPPRDLAAYRAWLDRGDHAGMGYMARPDRVERRADPTVILPGARSVITVAVSYALEPVAPEDDILRGRVSRYAWGEDYHDWLLPRLERLGEWIVAETSGERYRAYVDTGPVLERAFAARAGLGFVGKNTCLIAPRLGSWIFLGVVLVDVDLPPVGEPLPPRCGTCTRCLDACPTGALAAPYRVDARRCISYLTIEHKGVIPPALRPQMGDWVFGCDVCQAVCPWQRFARPTEVTIFQAPPADRARPALLELLALDEAGFRRRFRETPLLRTGRERLLRNAAVALGNLADPRATPVLRSALADDAPLVRGHAAWALGAIGGDEASEALQTALARETDPSVRQELTTALKGESHR